MLTFDENNVENHDIDTSVAALMDAPGAVVTKTRQNQASLDKNQASRFIDAINSLVHDGSYNRLVNIHGDADHDMHSVNMVTRASSLRGTYRFLAWHRVYLTKLEDLLQKVDGRVTIPYWRWTQERAFPEWLEGLKPPGLKDLDGNPLEVTRNPQDPSELPTKQDIASRLANNTYRAFTLALEGSQPPGAHNAVHMWVGGIMRTIYSPADPVFWMHHAECDRLWHIWQLENPDQHPPLLGSDAIMDPWPDRYKDVTNIAKLGYEYDDNTI